MYGMLMTHSCRYSILLGGQNATGQAVAWPNQKNSKIPGIILVSVAEAAD